MSESTRTSRAPAEKRLTYQQWKRRKMLRLARNWVLFLAGCAAVVALLTGGILWLLPLPRTQTMLCPPSRSSPPIPAHWTRNKDKNRTFSPLC